MIVGDLKEFKDLSKDGTGALRKGGTHHGQWVYRDAAGKLKVKPVYAFESVRKVREDLVSGYGEHGVVGFFQSKCLVRLDERVEHAKTPLEPGAYQLNTIRADGFCIVTSCAGKKSSPISLNALFKAGFCRIR